MIRVGFVFSFRDQSWLGGINYYRNLLSAIHDLPNREIEPVILTGFKVGSRFLHDFPPITVIRSKMFDRWQPLWFLRKILLKFTGFDLALEALCRKHRIEILSHSGYLRPGSKIRTLGWIFDFQHKHFPELFDAAETLKRNREFEGICRHCHGIIVSSRAARADLAEFFLEHVSEAKVLHFVAAPSVFLNPPSIAEVHEKHRLLDKFFLLPNQFWIHKNHGVVVDALAILRRRGQAVHVAATGNTHDHFRPHYFKELMDRVKSAGVEGEFQVLGIIPYADLRVLMQHAVALLNPSLFEGWSTTVEEAKSLGKQVLLSSIPVHREQAPDRGKYFEPKDAAALADLMWEAWTAFDSETDKGFREKAAADLKRRMREFGEEYEKIAVEILRNN